MICLCILTLEASGIQKKFQISIYSQLSCQHEMKENKNAGVWNFKWDRRKHGWPPEGRRQ
jgi:hypothetical protein